MSASSARGRLISFEGGEGVGKSTAIAAAVSALMSREIEVVQVREPGGTPLGESIRALLLAPEYRDMCAETELLLMFASRAQLLREKIAPALARGAWVVADRFTDASFAYQGGGRGLDRGVIAELERWAVGIKSDLVLLLDLPIAAGLARVRARGGEADRIEVESIAFFERVRDGYRQRALAEPQRWRVIDASQSITSVAAAVTTEIFAFTDFRGAPSQ
ncbi:MAG: dTMP kinase [Pseudomarimonas sp.]